MRVFRVLDRKAACMWDPSSSSVVHPSAEDEHSSVNRAKVMELLGVRSPQERQEIDSILSRSSQFESSTSSGEDICDEDKDDRVCSHENAIALPHPPDPVQTIATHVSNAASRKAYTHSPIAKTHLLQELATSNWGLKLLKFQCLADMSLVLNPVSVGKFSSSQPHMEKVRNNTNIDGARQEKIFPLPPPYPEKHFLPSPKRKDASPIAHPLPQPPPPLSPSNGLSEREEIATCSLLCVAEPNTREGAPLPSVSENSKGARVLSLDTSNKRISSMTYKLISPSDLAQKSPRPCHFLPSPPRIGGSALNSPSPSVALCLPGGGPTRNSPSPSPSPSSEHKRSLFLSSGGPILNSSSLSPAAKPLCPRKWRKGAMLGQGSFGIVHQGLNLEDGSFFAVKVSSTDDASAEIQQEVDLLSKLEHPNIVRYLGSSIEDGRLCIFIELVRMGSLEKILREYKLEENTVRAYTRQILHGLEYLHDQKTIHRDIKCANILVDVNGQVKLSDFGVAKQVGETLASSSKGTPLYMAPEVLTPKQNCYSFSADIWSLGCTILEMADGKPPWSNLEGFGFFFKVKNGELPPMPEHLSLEGRDFVCRCLKFNAKDRPTASELLQHPFVSRVSPPELSVPWVPLLRPSSLPCLNSKTCVDKFQSSATQCTL